MTLSFEVQRRLADQVEQFLYPENRNLFIQYCTDERLWMSLRYVLSSVDGYQVSHHTIRLVAVFLRKTSEIVEVSSDLLHVRPSWAFNSSLFLENVIEGLHPAHFAKLFMICIPLQDSHGNILPPGLSYSSHCIAVQKVSSTVWRAIFDNSLGARQAFNKLLNKFRKQRMLKAKIIIEKKAAFATHSFQLGRSPAILFWPISLLNRYNVPVFKPQVIVELKCGPSSAQKQACSEPPPKRPDDLFAKAIHNNMEETPEDFKIITKNVVENENEPVGWESCRTVRKGRKLRRCEKRHEMSSTENQSVGNTESLDPNPSFSKTSLHPNEQQTKVRLKLREDITRKEFEKKITPRNIIDVTQVFCSKKAD